MLCPTENGPGPARPSEMFIFGTCMWFRDERGDGKKLSHSVDGGPKQHVRRIFKVNTAELLCADLLRQLNVRDRTWPVWSA